MFNMGYNPALPNLENAYNAIKSRISRVRILIPHQSLSGFQGKYVRQEARLLEGFIDSPKHLRAGYDNFISSIVFYATYLLNRKDPDPAGELCSLELKWSHYVKTATTGDLVPFKSVTPDNKVLIAQSSKKTQGDYYDCY